MRGFRKDGTKLGFQIGYIPSDKQREKIRLALTGKKQPWISERNRVNNPMANPETREKMRKSHLGKTPWNADKTHPMYAAYIEKVREIGLLRAGKTPWNKGKTIETDSRITYGQSGENNPMWRGGTSFKRAGYRGALWKKQIRPTVLNRDGHACVRCGSKERLCVDHIIPFHQGGSNSLENLQTLCNSCHGKKTTKEEQKGFYGMGLLSRSRFRKED